MQTTSTTLRRRILAAAAVLPFAALASTVLAAPIPGLFNTGVDDNGDLLAPGGTVDPHYELIQSPDAGFPGPNAVTINNGYPVPPWVAEGPDSRWIAPTNASANAAPGEYIYRTTFDLTGFDPETAVINGEWATDDGGADIRINGTSSFSSSTGFGGFAEFVIDFGFVEGLNTLDFVVNNGGQAANPTGLRVEMIGSINLPGEAPSIRSQPVGDLYLLEGESITLRVIADGDDPLSYQWQLDGADVPGATDPTLELFSLGAADNGEYTVVVTNPFGTDTSEPAAVRAGKPLPGLFDTGVDNFGNPLFDYEIDPHYQIFVNPDSESPDAVVHDSTVFPIVEGPWLANSALSAWIAPAGDTIAAAGGDYTYRLILDLDDFDPETAFLQGNWTSDNTGVAIRVNGIATGVTNPGNFGGLNPFFIPSGPFVSGINTIDFVVNNASAGYTGLRVEGLVGGALIRELPPGAPRIVRQPEAEQRAVVGGTATFTVLVDGAAPLAYQWRRNGTNIDGANAAELVIAEVTGADEAEYDVVVSNGLGSATSETGSLVIVTPVPGVFATGLDESGAANLDYEIDPHYQLIVNAHSESPDAVVQDSFIWPILAPDGPWVANTERSKWIGPTADTNGDAGDYTYRLTFDLTGFDPATATVSGSWATDNGGTDILVNGVSTGLINTAQFAQYTPFEITSGFAPGTNTLDFVVNNAGDAANPTGLRVDGIEVLAVPRVFDIPPLTITDPGDGNVILAWPASFTEWDPFMSLDLLEWDPAPGAPVMVGDEMQLSYPLNPAIHTWFRLQRRDP